MKMTAAQMLRYLKDYRRLLLAEVDGRLWWSNSFALVRCNVDPRKDPVLSLLGDYNLKAEPMCCEVGKTIVRTGSEPVKFADLVKRYDKTAKVAAERVTIGGSPVLLQTNSFRRDVPVEVWRSGQHIGGFNPDHVAAVTWCTPGADWYGQATDRDAWVRRQGGEPIGLLMPLRISEAATADAFQRLDAEVAA